MAPVDNVRWSHQPVPPALLQGRLTLLLGPPGAGKSALLQTLGGQLLPSNRVRVRARLSTP